ncbi:MAG: RAM signaling network component [Icmadophila ericetorum]|nr:RAM signaling network component [Icmadophila ericetorum]
MPTELLDGGDYGLDGARDAFDGYRTPQQSFYPGNLSSDYEYHTFYEGPSPDPAESLEPGLPPLETISLVQTVVDAARQNQISLTGNERLGEAAKQLKLTIDLSRQNIELLPEKAIDILKRDVERFSECTALTYLNMRDNQLKDFPKPIYKLSHLQILDLSRNKLIRIPEEIKTMKALRVLSVMNNKLESLPFSLGFLDTLKILKLTSNPLNEGLKNILEGNDGSPAPLTVPLAENEKDVMLTKKIKKFLKNEAAALESGGESSESPLDTPRPLRRNTSLRFPVVPTTNGVQSGSESAPDLRSPGLIKSPTTAWVHHRLASGQNHALQNSALRRPGVAPFAIGNERNRSNSESVLQQTQNVKNKRMGMVRSRNPDTLTVNESRSQRNSQHLRGFSHSEILKDKHALVNGSSDSAVSVGSAEEEPRRAVFVHRLSSLPEHRRENSDANNIAEGAKGVLYSLHQVHPHILTLITLVQEGPGQRFDIQQMYHEATVHLTYLDKELNHFYRDGSLDGKPVKKPKEIATRNISVRCRTCIISYQQLGTLLLQSISQLVSKGDQRYIRTLLLLVYGSLIEARNACWSLGFNIAVVKANKGRQQIAHEEVQEPIAPSATPTKERPYPSRRLRSDTALQLQADSIKIHTHFKPTPNTGAAVPLYVNGRSRSNSRVNALAISNASSVASTPRSGESFTIPGGAHASSVHSAHATVDQDVLFEKIYLDFKRSIENGLSAIPQVALQFTRCYEVARTRESSREIQELWFGLISRCRSCQDLCEELKERLSTMKLKEPEVRNSPDFWRRFIRYANSFIKLIDGIKEAKRLQLIPADIGRVLQPVHRSVKLAISTMKNSPWAYTLNQNFPLQPPMAQSHWQSHGNGPMNGHINGQRFKSSHHRTRRGSGSGSSSSPYVNSIPATPLSAALGPAAQATVPSTPATSMSFDASFKGDVFQRAETYLNSHPNDVTALRRY